MKEHPHRTPPEKVRPFTKEQLDEYRASLESGEVLLGREWHLSNLKTIDDARATNARLNRRVQQAEAALEDAKRCIEKVDGGAPWCGGSLGRALLAWDNGKLRKELAEISAAVTAYFDALDNQPTKILVEKERALRASHEVTMKERPSL